MNEKLRRDSLITIIGLSIVVALFTFVVYLPGLKNKEQLNQEIAEIQQSICEIPKKVEQLEKLHQELDQRLIFINRHRQEIPTVKDTHLVLQRVALLAKMSNLTVSELNPGEFVLHETYLRQPFLLSISGPYSGLMQFLTGLENETRLFTVSNLSLTKQDGEAEGHIKGTLELSVYALHGNQRGFSDFAENRVSNVILSADKR
ncbi:MAG: type 4a pilus biogenesis protein PilO [Planctomycetota bacterium]|jgi:type IV pilus assembly protein PilO|uniref:type 4a pilus biogenesis protein PilO n=1 Tax=uncultured Gimesia sp. TaxID=1678688 RepID=UPI002626857F|nr:type 4a pilus biogenesis protein PilO [uncultured Gimesia sp.]